MSKLIKKMFVMCLVMAMIVSSTVYATEESKNNLKYKKSGILEKGEFATSPMGISLDPYKKIIRTYDELIQLKKYIRKNYYNPGRYLHKLKVYDRAFFKRKSLVFSSVTLDRQGYIYRFKNISVKGRTVGVNVERITNRQLGCCFEDELIWYSYTYIIEMKKSDVSKLKRIKINIKPVYREGYEN